MHKRAMSDGMVIGILTAVAIIGVGGGWLFLQTRPGPPPAITPKPVVEPQPAPKTKWVSSPLKLSDQDLAQPPPKYFPKYIEDAAEAYAGQGKEFIKWRGKIIGGGLHAGTVITIPRFIVSEVVDDQNMIVTFSQDNPIPVWIVAPTKGKIDSEVYSSERAYLVVGTAKRYARTMFQIRELTEMDRRAMSDYLADRAPNMH